MRSTLLASHVRGSVLRRSLRQPLARHASSSTVMDIASEADAKAGSTFEEGNVLLTNRKIAWKPRTAAGRVPVETSQLFSSSNDPLQHTESDVGRLYQLDGSTTAFEQLFYHTGLCGTHVEGRATQLQTSATLVRRVGLELRDELLGWQREGQLGERTGLLLNGERGVGKSVMLNYLLHCCHQAGWLVVAVPHAADWTLGLGAKSNLFANEAYRITDRTYFTDVPPELAETMLYEAPDASANFLIATYLSQREKLAQIAIKGEERRQHYAAHAADPAFGPTLADMLASFATDGHNGFADFPMPVRPVYDFLAELQLVTEMPTVLAVDGHNMWDMMASSCRWLSKQPLHASELLVPSMLADMHAYGGQMANGVMLCATSRGGGVRPKGVPKKLRKYFPPPRDYSRPRTLPAATRALLRQVEPYDRAEVQSALEFYALTGHLQNAELQSQLRTGEMSTKVGLLTAGVADDVFRIAEQM